MAGRKKWSIKLLDRCAAATLLPAVLFALGSVVGCIAADLLQDPGDTLLDYLRGYLSVARQSGVQVSFGAVLWQTVRVPLLVAAMGLTAFGVIGIPALFAYKGFALSYAVSMFYRMLGLPGLAAAAVLFGISAVVWLPVLLGLGGRGLLCSYGLLRRAAGDGRYPLGVDGGFLLRCTASLAALFLCAGIEYLVVPMLLQKCSGLFLPG